MRRLALLGMMLAGCNPVFGLEPTISIDSGYSDFDGDGIADDLDNCVTVKNEDQANADGDAFGDACDTCPMLASSSTHDEDGDRYGDDCDLCPGVPDFQTDADGDGIGDDCDPTPNGSTTPTRRVFFESFATQNDNWQAGAGAWSWANDSVGPVAPLAPTDRGLQRVGLTTSARWAANIAVESTELWGDGDQFGIVIVNGAQEARCLVRCASSLCTVDLVIGGSASSTNGVAPRPFALFRAGGTSTNLACSYEGPTGVGSQFAAEGAAFYLVASPRIRLRYIDYFDD